MPNTIWWIRRDLRLHDNQALDAALKLGNPVIPLFIIDPNLLKSPYLAEKRLAFLYGGLRALSSDLREMGSQLIVRQGLPLHVLSRIVAETDVTNIVAEEDVSPYAQQRDQRIQATLPLHLTPGVTILPLRSVLKQDNTAYRVYSAFVRQWHATATLTARQILPTPRRIPTPNTLHSDPIPDTPSLSRDALFIPGEQAAQERLSAFVHNEYAPINDYANNRDIPATIGTSQLSPYLRFGMISARVLALAAQDAAEMASSATARQSAETWLSELLWREFYQTILLYFPHSRRNSFNIKYDAIQWRNEEADFDAWCQGRTGYPFVDAAMRQLAQTGWMHNRARMVVAAFLIKDLLIDWRWGERWFMQQLIDGDPAANNGGWQWSAGTGPNAAPYFRIFNPITQATRFDPAGDYVYRWVPELGHVPKQFIHTPWKMSAQEQARYQCKIGQDYPAPIVHHEVARDTTLTVYKSALSQS